VHIIAVLKSRKDLKRKKTWAKIFFLKNKQISFNNLTLSKNLNKSYTKDSLKFYLNDFF
jgi:hypothetical protein